MSASLRAAAALGACLALVACATISGHVPPSAPRPGSGSFQAGAGEADLTPMPGFPMGGHSVAGQVARGSWGRLRARALYFEDAGGRAIALVSCDAWAMPAGLADRAADLVRESPDGEHLGRDRLVIAATHTHQSPGNAASSRFYNAFGSRYGGYDADLLEWQARRIADAVIAAVRSRRPAALFLDSVIVEGLCRNRSFEAFLLNSESRVILEENAALPAGLPSPYGEPPEAWRAVDPRLTVLRVQETGADGGLIAVAAFLAVHPTTMGHSVQVYQGDLFGWVAESARRKLAARAGRADGPVVALFNGAEGDVSPGWSTQDRRDLVRLGEPLARAVVELCTGGERVDGDIRHRFAVVPLAGHRFRDQAGGESATSEEPLPGAAMIGGAEDGYSVFHTLWPEGTRGPRLWGQGPKQPPFDPSFLPEELPVSFTREIIGRFPPPDRAAVGAYRIGRVVLGTLPGEFTTTMGRRVARSMRDASVQPSHVLLVGLANEYVSYFATPEEYEAQHYEGASTLWGPASGPLIESELARLARALDRWPPEAVEYRYRHRPGSTRRFRLEDVGAPPYYVDDGLAEILQDPSGVPERGLPRFIWTDGVPRLEGGKAATPRVWIEREEGGVWSPLRIDGVPEDDGGFDLVTVVLEVGKDSSSWASFWMPPPGLPGPPARYRFGVRTLAGAVRRSDPFALGGGTGRQ